MSKAIVDDKLQVRFLKKAKDNPQVSGIVLFDGGIEQTDFVSVNKKLNKLLKDRLEKENEKREIKQRQEKAVEFEDFEDDYQEPTSELLISIDWLNDPLIVLLIVLALLLATIFFLKRTKKEKED